MAVSGINLIGDYLFNIPLRSYVPCVYEVDMSYGLRHIGEYDYSIGLERGYRILPFDDKWLPTVLRFDESAKRWIRVGLQ